MDGIGALDWILLAIVAVSVLIGLWRGLVFEVLSLLGWVVAYVAAQLLAGTVAAHLPIGTPGSGVNHAAAFALTFIGVLIIWALAARLVRMLVGASPLSGLDRLLGALFGLLRGMLVLLAVTTVVAMTPAARSPVWQASRGAAWSSALLQELKPLLPDAIAQHLPA
jgi:membrane protein required for colicin V production